MSASRQATLAHAVEEIERHLAGGWDQPRRRYALVQTARLLTREPQLVATLGRAAGPAPASSLTPVEQQPLPGGPLEQVLGHISWPAGVLGCAFVQEVLLLPPATEAQAPAGDSDRLGDWAADQPGRREARLAVGVLRDGSAAATLRLRAPEPAQPAGGTGPSEAAEPRSVEPVVSGAGLAPNLAAALLETFE